MLLLLLGLGAFAVILARPASASSPTATEADDALAALEAAPVIGGIAAGLYDIGEAIRGDPAGGRPAPELGVFSQMVAVIEAGDVDDLLHSTKYDLLRNHVGATGSVQPYALENLDGLIVHILQKHLSISAALDLRSLRPGIEDAVIDRWGALGWL